MLKHVRLCVDGLARKDKVSLRAIESANVVAWDVDLRRKSPGLFKRCNSGFTTIELLVAIAIFSALMAMSMGAFSKYWAGRAIDSAQAEVTAQMREAQSLAVATGNTYRIDFSDSSGLTYKTQRRSGGSWVDVRSAQYLPGGVTFNSPTFGTESAYVEFYPRGNAEGGQVELSGRYEMAGTITVDGATANVR